jgi:hypothetical protein
MRFFQLSDISGGSGHVQLLYNPSTSTRALARVRVCVSVCYSTTLLQSARYKDYFFPIITQLLVRKFYHYNKRNNFMKQSPFREVNDHSISQEISRLLLNPNVHYRVHKVPPVDPILSRASAVHLVSLFPSVYAYVIQVVSSIHAL